MSSSMRLCRQGRRTRLCTTKIKTTLSEHRQFCILMFWNSSDRDNEKPRKARKMPSALAELVWGWCDEWSQKQGLTPHRRYQSHLGSVLKFWYVAIEVKWIQEKRSNINWMELYVHRSVHVSGDLLQRRISTSPRLIWSWTSTSRTCVETLYTWAQ